jgi:glutathione peroxidase-family protein
MEKLTGNKATSLFDFTMKDIDGHPVNFANYKDKNKAFIITNVACACGFAG